MKSSLRFTFCNVKGSVASTVVVASASSVLVFFPVVGVRSCPAKKSSLAICKGLRFFRGEGFVGSWEDGLLLRMVTFLLMACGVVSGVWGWSSCSEIGVLGR